MSCEEHFRSKLREHNFRLTPQREMVLSVMHQIQTFATAEEIYARVHERSSAVDISTVYRTLELLEGFQLVAHVDTGDRGRRYELVVDHDPHLHLVCRSCGRVLGAELVSALPLIDHLQETHNFEVDISDFSIPGLCSSCRTASEESRITLLTATGGSSPPSHCAALKGEG